MSDGPLLRAFHIKHSDQGEYVFLIVHHLVIDGFSAIEFVNELWRRYREPSQDHQALNGPTLDNAFFEFVEWERAYLAGDQADADRKYWLSHLRGVSPRIDLPYDTGLIPDRQVLGVGCESMNLDSGLLQNLRSLASACHAPLWR